MQELQIYRFKKPVMYTGSNGKKYLYTVGNPGWRADTRTSREGVQEPGKLAFLEGDGAGGRINLLLHRIKHKY